MHATPLRSPAALAPAVSLFACAKTSGPDGTGGSAKEPAPASREDFVQIEETPGQLRVGYFEFLPPSMLD